MTQRRSRVANLALVIMIWLAALGVAAGFQTTGSTVPPLAIKSLDLVKFIESIQAK